MSEVIFKEAPPTRAYWVSWYNEPMMGAFELHRPWWVSGYRADDAQTICAAIIATSEHHAKEVVLDAYDETPESIEWRFVEPRDNDWTPFNDRFPRADWMKWPAT